MDAFAPGRAEATLARALEGIAALVRACHPPDEARWLTDVARRLSRKAKPLRPKEPRTASIEELIRLGERLLAEGRELLDSGKRHGAALFRDGLIILTLVAHPIRRSNLAALQLGKTVFVEGTLIHVRFAAEDTKNGVELPREYPAWLVVPFQEYLEAVRPILRETAEEPDEGWVWIGRCGNRMAAQSLRVITTNRTRKYLGRAVPPHNFRHSTVTDVARFDPEHIGIAKDVLGHRTYATTEDYYILADSFTAFSEYQAVVERRRRHRST
jgi:integrase/recombinase XerD